MDARELAKGLFNFITAVLSTNGIRLQQQHSSETLRASEEDDGWLKKAGGWDMGSQRKESPVWLPRV